jgi:hypothetical protein
MNMNMKMLAIPVLLLATPEQDLMRIFYTSDECTYS